MEGTVDASDVKVIELFHSSFLSSERVPSLTNNKGIFSLLKFYYCDIRKMNLIALFKKIWLII